MKSTKTTTVVYELFSDDESQLAYPSGKEKSKVRVNYQKSEEIVKKDDIEKRKKIRSASSNDEPVPSRNVKPKDDVGENKQFWKPDGNAEHCKEGREYLDKNPGQREIFDSFMALVEKKGSNFRGKCRACDYSRSGSAGSLLGHFLEKKCSLSVVPRDRRNGLLDHLENLAEKEINDMVEMSNRLPKSAIQPRSRKIDGLCRLG